MRLRLSCLLTLLTALLAASLLHAQTALQPPPVGILLQYTYWPAQYVQFVGTELPYTMFELDVDNTVKPTVYQVTLTGRGSGQRTIYANSDAVVMTAKAGGSQAYKTEIAVDGGDSTANGSTTDVRMTMADGKPLLWHFVQGSDLSEQGSGLTDLSAIPVPVFAYREQGAVAGEGTALKIGDVVSTADMWMEISHPPQFVAYRGAITASAHTIVFAPGKDTWTTTAAPDALKPGGVWEVDATNGNHLTLKIEKADGARYTIAGSDRFHPAVRFALEASRNPDNIWSLERIRMMPVKDGDKHTVTVAFTPALGPTAANAALEITEGKKARVASATVSLAGTPGDRTATVTFTAPKWAAGKSMVEETILGEKTITTVAHPAAKP